MGDKERNTILAAAEARRAADRKEEGVVIDSSGSDQLRKAREQLKQ